MKTQALFHASIVAALLSCSSSFAGEKAGNGGDACERRIKEIRDDITQWIVGGGSSGLKLNPDMSLTEYNQQMTAMILNAGVSCQDEPIRIDSAEKTCMNFKDDQGRPQILCNRNAFTKNTSEDDQYILVHHEYAGLAGFEVNDGPSSSYFLSNQLTRSLQTVRVKKLSLQPTQVPTLRDDASLLQLPAGTILTVSKDYYLEPNLAIQTILQIITERDNWKGAYIQLSPNPEARYLPKDKQIQVTKVDWWEDQVLDPKRGLYIANTGNRGYHLIRIQTNIPKLEFFCIRDGAKECTFGQFKELVQEHFDITLPTPKPIRYRFRTR